MRCVQLLEKISTITLNLNISLLNRALVFGSTPTTEAFKLG